MTPVEKQLIENTRRWRTNSKAFCNEALGMQLDPWQEDVCTAYDDPAKQRISMQACAGPGKSAMLAVLAWHFISCMGDAGHHPQGVAVSVTWENLRDGLWKELSVWQQRNEWLSRTFVLEKERLFARDYPLTWFLSARSFPKTASPEVQGKTLSGLHGKYILGLVDESGAIPTTIMRALEQALANTYFGKAMQAGNPISLEGMLYAAATQLRHLWTIIRITGDPDDPKAWVHSPRIVEEAKNSAQSPADWAREQIRTYGRDNPWVKSYILGQFPDASINSLLGIEDVEAAMSRHLHPDTYDWQQKRLGVDVARFGDDRSVIFPRQGLAAFKPVVLRNLSTADIAARVALAVRNWKSELQLVDDTGHWGHGVIDQLNVAGIPNVGVVFHGKALNVTYANRRAEMWLEMADWVKKGGALPNEPSLVAELTTPTYTFQQGKLLLEDKDQIKKRLGRSPDIADALALTFAIPDLPANIQNRARRLKGLDPQRNQAAADWNPYANDDLGV